MLNFVVGSRGGTGRTAVYRVFGRNDVLLYVGASANPDDRLQSHSRQHSWWPQVVRWEIDWHDDRLSAKLAEARAVRELGPLYNNRLTPDSLTVPFSFRLSMPEAERVDSVRGALSRSEWVRAAVLKMLAGGPAVPDLVQPARSGETAAAPGQAGSADRGGRESPAAAAGEDPAGTPDRGRRERPPPPRRKTGSCGHRGLRLAKGVCPDCHEWVQGR